MLQYESVFQKSDEYDYYTIQNFFCQKSKLTECFKWTYGLSGNDYRVATLPKSYLIDIGINMQQIGNRYY